MVQEQTVLILGETHAEYLYDETLKSSNQDDRRIHELWLKQSTTQIRLAIEEFNPSRVFMEVRPMPGFLGATFVRARVPKRKRVSYLERERDPSIYTDKERESRMANLVFRYLESRHSGSRVAVVCGAKHAEGLGKTLVKLGRKKANLRCAIRYIRLTGLESPFKDRIIR